MPFFTSTFERTREQKQAQRKAAIERAEAALAETPISPNAETILVSPIEAIAEKIRATEWSSTEVVATFARRCVEAHHDLNCLTEVMIAEALNTAQEQDAYQSRTSTTLGPLHGIPYTLKDTFDVSGYDSSLGFSSLSNAPAHQDSVLHATLSRLGGILLAKTNIPQTLLAFECNNPIFGKTENPVVRGFTSGGSSGGEAAVLGRNGSAIGFGSDIGGSLRIPTGWCGIFALKTVHGRFTKRGHMSIDRGAGLSPGFEGIPSVTGPMGRNVQDLKLVTKLILDADLTRFDATVIPAPWDESKFAEYATKKKLKFGYYFDDGVTISSPPVKRAIEETVKALEAQGHEVEFVDPPNVIEAVRIFIALSSQESYYNLRAPLKDDPMESSVKFILTVGGWPRWFRTFVTYVVHYILRDPVTAATVALVGNKTAGQSVSWVSKRQAFRQEFNDFFAHGEFDALITPVSTIPAAKVNGTTMVSALATSTLLYNVLDYPAGAVPVTTVKEGEVMDDARWKGREREGYAWMFLDQVYGKGQVYKKIMEDGVGLPVGVQVVGSLRAGEEGVLALMERVYDAVKA